MSLPPPPPAARPLVASLLQTLASAQQTYALYPDGHPHRTAAARELHADTRALQAAMSSVPTLFITRSSLYLGPTLLARESMSLLRLIEAFEQAGITTVELTAATDEADLDGLLRSLRADHAATDGPGHDRLGGILVNRVRPAVNRHDAGPLDLGELRRTYATGLEMVRQTAARILAGDTVDLAAVTTVVEHFADEVAADPASALLLSTVRVHDEPTYYHMVNVGLLAIALGQHIGLRRDQVVSLGIGGLLHDVGKIRIPTEVLAHPGPLSDEQRRIVEQHPLDGAALLFGTGAGLYHPAATVVLEHHAAYDLRGYPQLSGRRHPSVPARLVAVVDVFDAVTSARADRPPADRARALEILRDGMGTAFDPRVVRTFAAMMGRYPVGSLVALDTGETALVLAHHDELETRPRVLVALDADGNPAEPEERDLSSRRPDGCFRWEVAGTVDPHVLGIDVTTLVTTGEVVTPPSAGSVATSSVTTE